MTIALTSKIRKAIVKTCMSEGIENEIDILTEAVKAMRSVGTMTVAGYKAHATRRKMAIRRKFRRK